MTSCYINDQLAYLLLCSKNYSTRLENDQARVQHETPKL